MSIYYITNATRVDKVITELRAAKDSKTTRGEIFSKSEMIALLGPGRGNSAKTWNQIETADVRVVGGKYLRTDSNDTQADNLGELPPV